MKKYIISFICVAILLAGGIAYSQRSNKVDSYQSYGIVTPRPTPKLCFSDTITPSQIIALTNGERAKAGISPLTDNPLLDQAAQMKANDMITVHYWAHDSPTGVEPWYWFGQAGYRYAWAGENLAENFVTSDGVMEHWMASPGHKANLLKSVYDEVGVAVTCGVTDRDTTLIVAEYGSR